MATTLFDILQDAINRTEEENEDGVAAPIFWSQEYEYLPQIVDSLFEAALITGTVQANNVAVVLEPDQTYFSLQTDPPEGVPPGVLFAVRMRAPNSLRKTTLRGLSDMVPGWERTPPSQQIAAWFPVGTSMFGIWPQVSVETRVVMDFIVSPTPYPRPYDTSIEVPFEEQFISAFSEYAAAMLRSKELGNEASEASSVMESYLAKMQALSRWQNRLDSLVMSGAYGARAQTNRREIV